MELILGHAGTDHIDAQEFRNLFAGILGEGNYILHGMEASVVNSNTVRISEGGGASQGAYFETDPSGESVSVDNGTQGMKRHDLICVEYKKTGNIESMGFKVVKGTPSTDPQDPSYAAGKISSGATVQFPFFRVRLNGLSIDGVDTLATHKAELGADSIVESGTYYSWAYKKYANGDAVCELKGANIRKSGAANPWGGVYYAESGALTFPPGLFVEAPIVHVDPSGSVLWFPCGNATKTKDQVSFYVGRGTPTTGDVAGDVTAKGRWQ